MGRHMNTETGVVFSVADDKDARYGSHPYGPAGEQSSEDKPKRGPGRPRKSD